MGKEHPTDYPMVQSVVNSFTQRKKKSKTTNHQPRGYSSKSYSGYQVTQLYLHIRGTGRCMYETFLQTQPYLESDSASAHWDPVKKRVFDYEFGRVAYILYRIGNETDGLTVHSTRQQIDSRWRVGYFPE